MRHAVLTVLLFLPAGVIASDAMLDHVDAIVEQARRIEEQAKKEPPPEWVSSPVMSEADQRAIEDIASQAAEIQTEALSADLEDRTGMAAPGAAARGRRIEILVSWSLGEAALREIAAEVSAYPKAVMVFRGIPEGLTFGAAVKRIQSLVSHIDPIPSVVIDPTRFQEHGVDHVPVIAIYDAKRLMAIAHGTFGIRYLLSRVDSGARGDLGTIGPMMEVSEPDLIEVMKARLAAIDFDSAKARAAERYWDKLGYVSLPLVTEPRRRTFDPSVIVTADITDAKGNIITPAGKRINPLDALPFDQRIYVFDASRADHVAAAKKMKEQYRDRRLLLIATRFDRAAGWDGFKQLQDGLRAPVYLLNEQFRARFHIERVPSLIEAVGKEMVVHEIPPGRDQG